MIKNTLLTLLLVQFLFLTSNAQGPNRNLKFSTNDLGSASALADPVVTPQFPTIFPPSPTSAELGRYGSIVNGNSTGGMNLHIPLYEYATKNLKIPLSLSYASNGLRVNAIGSRAGFDWVANLGGVITRTVYDEPDLSPGINRLAAANFNVRNDALYKYLEDSMKEIYDTQPDVFSYNFHGYTGKFIFDDTGKAVSLPHNNLKIDFIYNPTTGNYFVVTTPEGIKYYFGGIGATEASKHGSSYECGGSGGSRSEFIDNSWYLNKIEHPLGDIISFTYEGQEISYRNGVSETVYVANPGNVYGNVVGGGPRCSTCQILASKVCYDNLTSYIVRVKEITSSGHGKVIVNYKSNINLDDKLIADIVVYNSTNQRIKKFLLDHQVIQSSNHETANTISQDRFRAFLSSVIEYGKTDVLPKKHEFLYKDLTQLPVKFSFSQDAYGFYNGKSNAWLVPKPERKEDRDTFGNRGGDKTPNAEYSSKGMLIKVIYPTKGQSEFTYEGNDIWGTENIQLPAQTKLVAANGTDESYFGTGDPVVTTETFTLALAQQVKVGAYFANYLSPIEDSDTHIKMELSVTVNGVSQIFDYIRQNESKTYDLGIPANVPVVFKVSVWGYNGFNGSADFRYDVPPQTITHNIQMPGVRIQKSIDVGEGLPEIKKYIYRSLENKDRSSAIKTSKEDYIEFVETRFYCTEPQFPIHREYFCRYDVLYSNSISAASTSPVDISYQTVLLSYGENYENGGVEYKYRIAAAPEKYPLIGRLIESAPNSNLDYANGALLQENNFKYVNNNVVYLRKQQNVYKEDTRNYKKTSGYTTKRNYTITGIIIPSPPGDEFFEPYQVTRYDIHSYWNYLDSAKVTQYDQNGANPVTTITRYLYDNPVHSLISRIDANSSNGKSNVDSYKYPQDLTLTGTAETARAKLISNNQIATILSQSKTVNGKAEITNNEYLVRPTSNFVLLSTVSTNTKPDNTFEERMKYYDYDLKGSLLSISRESGPKTIFIWAYKNQYPIAKIENAELATVIAVLGGQANVDAFRDQALPASTAVSTFLAPLRTDARLSDAQVTTYSYEPMVGVLTARDPKGEVTTYEYDDQLRLKLIKDNSGNIIKTINYNFKP